MPTVAVGVVGVLGLDQVRRALPLVPEQVAEDLAETAEAGRSAHQDS